jgi:tetratricopeptide (TPR) repeat protein
MQSLCLRYTCAAALAFFAARGETLQWRENLERAFDLQGRHQFAQAEALLSGLLARAEQQNPGDSRIGAVLNALGAVYQETGQYLEAENAYLRSLALLERTLGPDDPYLVSSGLLPNLAVLYWRTGELSKAKTLLDRGLRIAEEKPGIDASIRATLLSNRASIAARRGQYAEARSLLEKALRLAAEDPQSAIAGSVLNNLAAVAVAQHDLSSGLAYSRRSVEIFESHQADVPAELARALLNLGLLEERTGARGEAESHIKRALVVAEGAYGPGHPMVGSVLASYGVLLARQGRRKEAKRMKQRAQAIQARSRQENSLGLTVDAGVLMSSLN